MSKILILSTLLCCMAIYSTALSLSGRKEYNSQDYAQALVDEQNQFDIKVAEVQSEIGKVNNILSNSTITNKVKLVLVSEGMADERNTLLDMQQILKLPFELR
jgi:predicted S18 family serine protease